MKLQIVALLLLPLSSYTKKFHMMRSRDSSQWTAPSVPFAEVDVTSAQACQDSCKSTKACKSVMLMGYRCTLYKRFCPPCPHDTFTLEGLYSRYKLHVVPGSEPITVEIARQQCLHQHMHLLALETKKEFQAISNYLINNGKELCL